MSRNKKNYRQAQVLRFTFEKCLEFIFRSAVFSISVEASSPKKFVRGYFFARIVKFLPVPQPISKTFSPSEISISFNKTVAPKKIIFARQIIEISLVAIHLVHFFKGRVHFEKI